VKAFNILVESILEKFPANTFASRSTGCGGGRDEEKLHYII
jgi:hypothetical protein